MRLEHWAVVAESNKDPYAAPETRTQLLNGIVFDHPRFSDGTFVTTSAIVGKNSKNEILTASGSSYRLGRVCPFYEKMFSGAKNRLLDSL